MDYNQCSQIFIQEIALLDKIVQIQSDIMNAVINRDRTDFETHSITLEEASSQFENLEEERIASCQGQSNWTHFYTEVARLPDIERTHLTELYRNLKLKIHKVRTSNDTLTMYLNEAKSTVAAFVDAAFPDRRGRRYGRTGAHISADMRSLLVDASV
jgi:small-conductance mechanosensitive channel